MQYHANRQGMKIQDAFQGITKWRNYFPAPKISSKEESTKKKNQETGKNTLEEGNIYPRFAQNALFMNQCAACSEAPAVTMRVSGKNNILLFWVMG
jgi:hypothetical protein